jgi:hypothetical protein
MSSFFAGNFCIRDLSPHGGHFRDRFLCRGQQILNFRIFRYSLPDPNLSREFDLNVDLKMAAITYVHTQRFYATLVDFFNQFHRLQASVADPDLNPPDPHVFGPPGSGSFYHQVNIVRKTK